MGASTPRPCAESRIGPIVTILAAAAALVAADGIVGDAHEPDDTTAAAITMDFVPPPPGSYALHAIMRAPDGPVLDPDGRRLPLSRFTAGKITLLGFIYTSCADARGCPLAYQVFHTVRHRVSDDPDLRDHVRLVSLSFDPARDTPDVMRRHPPASPLVTPEWLAQNLGRRDVRVVDGSWHMPQLKRDARAEFAEAHVPGAVFFDIDQIADPRTSLPHMLPRASDFAHKVGQLGI